MLKKIYIIIKELERKILLIKSMGSMMFNKWRNLSKSFMILMKDNKQINWMSLMLVIEKYFIIRAF
jgi:hypothetical protein